MPLKAVIFDLDGTLINSPLSLDAVREDLGLDQKRPILEYVSGLPRCEQEAAEKVIRSHEVAAARKAELIEGVFSMLEKLRESEIKIGLLTRNCKPATECVIDKLSLQFDAVLTRDCAPPKPNPAGLLQLLGLWSLTSENAIYVGDYLFDIQTGKNAAVKTALFVPGDVPDYAAQADWVFSSFDEFSKKLFSLIS